MRSGWMLVLQLGFQKSWKTDSWRCKEKPKQHQSYTARELKTGPTLVDIDDQLVSRTTNELDEAVLATRRRSINDEQVQCCCGKICKGTRGLKAHQRTCRFIKGLNDERYSTVDI